MSGKVPTHWEILKLLKSSRADHLSGPEIASRLGISRTGVWKHIKKLTAMGYTIDTHPKSGYRLVDPPDLLIPEEVVPDLTTKAFGRSYHHFHALGSTNDRALALAMEGAPHGTVVVAEQQTAGRGRLKRPWVSDPRNGIYMSILLRTSVPIRDAHQSTLLAAISLVKTLRTACGLKGSIKWPNDVLIENKKVAGILTEMQSDQDNTRFLVIGIGINVNHGREDLQGPFRYPATSLAIESGRRCYRQHVLAQFLNRFDADYEELLNHGFDRFLEEFEANSSVLGKVVTIHCGTAEYVGKVAGFTPQGALRLLIEGKGEEILWVGDVTQVEGEG